jgi:signal transduction histidine kinase
LKELVAVFEHDRALDGARVELEAPAPVWVEADAGQLRQVVWNLVRNACQAAPAGTPVQISVGTIDQDNARWARLSVRDRGPGIPPEHRTRIFEPFFSTKEGGTGLGLATVHRIVEEHHGRVLVIAPADGGTELQVLLPIAKDRTAAPR